ncbi:MAG TPA: YicC/YloC family endoribonuclease [Nitrospiria bacterium]|nr:YicC/YloC family endoribonuclease [Nitrospiria bacterium]
MTGYGRAEQRGQGMELAVELRTVNHRYSELNIKLPRSLAHLETAVKERVTAWFARGRVDLSVTLNGRGGVDREVVVDTRLARSYIRQLRSLQRHYGLRGELEIGHLAGVRELLTINEAPSLPPAAGRTVLRLLRRAARQVEAMRRTEGRALGADLERRVTAIEGMVERVRRRLPAVVEGYHRRLAARAAELAGAAIGSDRLAQEVALYAERCDVSEELVRLASHIGQFRGHLKSREPIGRTLDFLLQEMNREVNTLGSKANDALISSEVVTLKGELEKIREQVQNVE